MAFFFVMENIHEHQVEEILPYQYEPEPGAETSIISDESDSEQGSVLSLSEEEIDNEFERANAWHLETPTWCKCGHCAVSTKLLCVFAATKKRWNTTNTERFSIK